MYWKSQIQSPKEKNNSLLMNYSRISQRTTDANRSSSKTFDNLELESSFTETMDKNISHIKTASTPIRNKIIQKKMRNGNKNDEIKRNYFSKILINKMINIRLAFKRFQTLPIKIFKKGQAFNITRQIIFKTKLNIQTSILRTLLVAQERKKITNSTALSLQRGQNIFVHPSPQPIDHSNQKISILKLAELIKLPIKNAVQQFSSHYKEIYAKNKYFNKICTNYQFSRKIAFLIIKLLPNSKAVGKNAKNQYKNKQLKLLWYIFGKKYIKKMSYSLNCIKICSWNIKFKQELIAKQLILCSKLRREQSFNVWKAQLKNQKIVQSKGQISEQKLNALKRIFVRNKLLLWYGVTKRRELFNKVARRIGCYSKINQQKSFWRLLLNSH